MGFWDKLKGEVVDIIQWLDETGDTMVYRFERYGNEIKYGAKLVVRESQIAVFVNEGRIADVFGPGTYTLETRNMPVMSTLNNWMHGFQSPFKAEVYFVSSRVFTSLGWGTKNPIMLRDPEFGPIRIRAYGKFAIRISDPALFIKDVAGTNGHFSVEYINEQLRDLIVSRFTDVVGQSKIPVLDMAGNYDGLASFIHNKISPEFNSFGVEIAKLLIENISLPPNVEEALDKRSSMGIIGNLSTYTQFQAANALEEAAKNPGGAASSGVGMVMGLGMMNQLQQSYSAPPQITPPQLQPPPTPKSITYFVSQNGQQTGPFEINILQSMIQQNTLQPQTLVWQEGLPSWISASQAAELSGLFAQVPPALPPAPPSLPPVLVNEVPENSANYVGPVRTVKRGEKLVLNEFLDSDVLKIGINWTENKLQTSAAILLLSGRKKIEKESDFIFYNNLMSNCGGAKLHSSAISPYKQSMDFRLDKLPNETQSILLVLTIDQDEQPPQAFENFKNLEVDLIDPLDRKIEARFTVSELVKETAAILVEIYRHQEQWKVKAVGDGFNKGLEAILREYSSENLSIL